MAENNQQNPSSACSQEEKPSYEVINWYTPQKSQEISQSSRAHSSLETVDTSSWLSTHQSLRDQSSSGSRNYLRKPFKKLNTKATSGSSGETLYYSNSSNRNVEIVSGAEGLPASNESSKDTFSKNKESSEIFNHKHRKEACGDQDKDSGGSSIWYDFDHSDQEFQDCVPCVSSHTIANDQDKGCCSYSDGDSSLDDKTYICGSNLGKKKRAPTSCLVENVNNDDKTFSLEIDNLKKKKYKKKLKRSLPFTVPCEDNASNGITNLACKGKIHAGQKKTVSGVSDRDTGENLTEKEIPKVKKCEDGLSRSLDVTSECFLETLTLPPTSQTEVDNDDLDHLLDEFRFDEKSSCMNLTYSITNSSKIAKPKKDSLHEIKKNEGLKSEIVTKIKQTPNLNTRGTDNEVSHISNVSDLHQLSLNTKKKEMTNTRYQLRKKNDCPNICCPPNAKHLKLTDSSLKLDDDDEACTEQLSNYTSNKVNLSSSKEHGVSTVSSASKNVHKMYSKIKKLFKPQKTKIWDSSKQTSPAIQEKSQEKSDCKSQSNSRRVSWDVSVQDEQKDSRRKNKKSSNSKLRGRHLLTEMIGGGDNIANRNETIKPEGRVFEGSSLTASSFQGSGDKLLRKELESTSYHKTDNPDSTTYQIENSTRTLSMTKISELSSSLSDDIGKTYSLEKTLRHEARNKNGDNFDSSKASLKHLLGKSSTDSDEKLANDTLCNTWPIETFPSGEDVSPEIKSVNIRYIPQNRIIENPSNCLETCKPETKSIKVRDCDRRLTPREHRIETFSHKVPVSSESRSHLNNKKDDLSQDCIRKRQEIFNLQRDERIRQFHSNAPSKMEHVERKKANDIERLDDKIKDSQFKNRKKRKALQTGESVPSSVESLNAPKQTSPPKSPHILKSKTGISTPPESLHHTSVIHKVYSGSQHSKILPECEFLRSRKQKAGNKIQKNEIFKEQPTFAKKSPPVSKNIEILKQRKLNTRRVGHENSKETKETSPISKRSPSSSPIMKNIKQETIHETVEESPADAKRSPPLSPIMKNIRQETSHEISKDLLSISKRSSPRSPRVQRRKQEIRFSKLKETPRVCKKSSPRSTTINKGTFHEKLEEIQADFKPSRSQITEKNKKGTDNEILMETPSVFKQSLSGPSLIDNSKQEILHEWKITHEKSEEAPISSSSRYKSIIENLKQRHLLEDQMIVSSSPSTSFSNKTANKLEKRSNKRSVSFHDTVTEIESANDSSEVQTLLQISASLRQRNALNRAKVHLKTAKESCSKHDLSPLLSAFEQTAPVDECESNSCSQLETTTQVISQPLMNKNKPELDKATKCFKSTVQLDQLVPNSSMGSECITTTQNGLRTQSRINENKPSFDRFTNKFRSKLSWNDCASNSSLDSKLATANDWSRPQSRFYEKKNSFVSFMNNSKSDMPMASTIAQNHRYMKTENDLLRPQSRINKTKPPYESYTNSFESNEPLNEYPPNLTMGFQNVKTSSVVNHSKSSKHKAVQDEYATNFSQDYYHTNTTSPSQINENTHFVDKDNIIKLKSDTQPNISSKSAPCQCRILNFVKIFSIFCLVVLNVYSLYKLSLELQTEPQVTKSKETVYNWIADSKLKLETKDQEQKKFQFPSFWKDLIGRFENFLFEPINRNKDGDLKSTSNIVETMPPASSSGVEEELNEKMSIHRHREEDLNSVRNKEEYVPVETLFGERKKPNYEVPINRYSEDDPNSSPNYADYISGNSLFEERNHINEEMSLNRYHEKDQYSALNYEGYNPPISSFEDSKYMYGRRDSRSRQYRASPPIRYRDELNKSPDQNQDSKKEKIEETLSYFPYEDPRDIYDTKIVTQQQPLLPEKKDPMQNVEEKQDNGGQENFINENKYKNIKKEKARGGYYADILNILNKVIGKFPMKAHHERKEEESVKKNLEDKLRLLQLEEEQRLLKLEEKQKLLMLKEKQRRIQLDEKQRRLKLKETQRLLKLKENQRLSQFEEKLRNLERKILPPKSSPDLIVKNKKNGEDKPKTVTRKSEKKAQYVKKKDKEQLLKSKESQSKIKTCSLFEMFTRKCDT